MSRIFLLLLLLSSISFSVFQRPWTNETWISENPNIWTFGAELWWNVPAFQSTLESFRAGDYPGSAPSVSAELEKASTAISSARGFHDLCILRMLGSLGGVAFNPGQSFFGLFSRTSECMAYRNSWKSSVDHALRAIELSLSEAEQSINLAKASYAGLVFSGICESDYAGPGSENCSEFRSAFLSVANNITEGDYGKYALALERSEELHSDLSNPLPDLSNAKTVLDLIWSKDGAVESFDALRRRMDLAKNNSMSEFQLAYKAGLSKRSISSSKVAELEKEDYELISRAASGLKVGSIAKRFSDLKDGLSDISLLLSESKNEFDSVNRKGYLSGSVSKAVSSDERLSEIISKLDALERDARAAVSDQEDEAKDEISSSSEYLQKSGGSDSALHLEKAEKALSRAGEAGSLGTKFVFLSEAAALARAARSANATGELSRASNLSAAHDLIERGEMDGLNLVSERQALQAIENLPAPVSLEKTRELISLITSKARSTFEPDLAARRMRILEKLSLAGKDASDLKSELDRIEKGVISNGAIQFPDAIGSLKELYSGYALVEGDLDTYMSEIVGNSMSVSASPLIINANLDSPTEIILDLALANPKRYSSRNAEVKVYLDRPISFIIGDIIQGRDDVESVRMADGNRVVSITLSEVGSYETKRIIFNKKQIIGRKLSDKYHAEGLGDGSAFLSRRIEFELDTLVGSISLPNGLPNPLIDGESKKGPFPSGIHVIEAEGIMPDAYSQAIENVQAYGIGTNSKIEFDVVLIPKMDLDGATVFFDSINDSSVRSFDIVSASGQVMKNKRRISETRLAAEIGELRKGRQATIRVSYLVENTKDFVQRQIALLSVLNLSKDAYDLMEKAKYQALSGNYTDALELLEKMKAAQKEAEERLLKGREKFDALSADAKQEIVLLDSIISRSAVNDTFIQKLSARKNELEKSLERSNESDFDTLEEIDSKWLDKEASLLRKDLYKKYNDLKERFFNAGNSSTPREFVEFEDLLIKFETAQGYESTPLLLESMDSVEKIVKLQEASFKAGKDSLRHAFETAKSDLLSSWDKYSRQASAAKGTDFSGMFTETERNVNSLIRSAESSIDGDPRAFLDRLEELNSTKSKLDSTLELLREQSLSRISLVDETPENEEELGRARALVERGEFINALRLIPSASKEPDSAAHEDIPLPILGVTAIAMLGAAGFLLMKPKKEMRKLNAWKLPSDADTRKFNPEK